MDPLIEIRELKYIAVWPGEDRAELKYGGEIVFCPPCTEVADPSEKGTCYRYPSARDENGKFIPGTVEISDRYSRTDIGVVKSFDAHAFCVGLAANDAMRQRGLGITTRVDRIKEIMEAGRPMWENHIAEAYRKRVRRDLRIEHDWEKSGVPRPPRPDDDERRLSEAVKMLKKFKERKTVQDQISAKELREALSGETIEPTVPEMSDEEALKEPTEVTPRRRRKVTA